MAVDGMVMSVVQNILSALQSSELKDMLSVFGYKSELENLQHTVSTIEVVLRDSARKHILFEGELKLIHDLKDVVYEADDFLDNCLTLAEQKQLLDADSSLSEKLRHFFNPSKNHLGLAYKMCKGVKKIRKRFDAILDHNLFNFVHDPEPIRNRRPETCSYVNTVDIIGREQDLEKIIGKEDYFSDLVPHNSHKNLKLNNSNKIKIRIHNTTI